jgi:hypothetical protein
MIADRIKDVIWSPIVFGLIAVVAAGRMDRIVEAPGRALGN